MKYLIHVPNIILGAVDDDGDYDGDDIMIAQYSTAKSRTAQDSPTQPIFL